MRIRTIEYYLYEGVKGVLRNGIMSFASIATVASCIFILALSFCLAANLSFALLQVENSVGVSVIIDDEISAEQVNELYDTILAMEYVDYIDYISAEEALKSFSEQIGDSKGILAGLEDDNPLPRSFSITIIGAENQGYIIEALEKLQKDNKGISSVKHAKNTIDFLVGLNNGVRMVSLVVVLGLGSLATIIIINTIRLTVNNRKTEINIMKYVGATDWFIRWPFIIEGMLIGIAGAIIPIIVCYFSYEQVVLAVYENISVIRNLIEFQSKNVIFLSLTPAAILLGGFIGIVGSFSSVRKYLHV